MSEYERESFGSLREASVTSALSALLLSASGFVLRQSVGCSSKVLSELHCCVSVQRSSRAHLMQDKWCYLAPLQ